MLCVPGILSHYKFLARNGGFLQDKNWLTNRVYYNYPHIQGMNGLFMKLVIVNKDQFFATLTRSEVEYMNCDYNPNRQLR